jgi:hypothetical protein
MRDKAKSNEQLSAELRDPHERVVSVETVFRAGSEAGLPWSLKKSKPASCVTSSLFFQNMVRLDNGIAQCKGWERRNDGRRL